MTGLWLGVVCLAALALLASWVWVLHAQLQGVAARLDALDKDLRG